ncbi:hypothetical protein [Blastococcus sp. CT_GayMR20]|nr:hypothetical protein [Blastococcus sp. CT_GayMR20]
MAPWVMDVYASRAEKAGDLATETLTMGARDVTKTRSGHPGMFDLQIDWP